MDEHVYYVLITMSNGIQKIVSYSKLEESKSGFEMYHYGKQIEHKEWNINGEEFKGVSITAVAWAYRIQEG